VGTLPGGAGKYTPSNSGQTAERTPKAWAKEKLEKPPRESWLTRRRSLRRNSLGCQGPIFPRKNVQGTWNYYPEELNPGQMKFLDPTRISHYPNIRQIKEILLKIKANK